MCVGGRQCGPCIKGGKKKVPDKDKGARERRRRRKMIYLRSSASSVMRLTTTLISVRGRSTSNRSRIKQKNPQR